LIDERPEPEAAAGGYCGAAAAGGGVDPYVTAAGSLAAIAGGVDGVVPPFAASATA
jgi:hypothetical protein